MPLTRPRPRRRHAIANPRRFAPLAATGVVARGAGIAVGSAHVPGERKTVMAFVTAWERGDQRAMYALLSDKAKARTSIERLQRTYNQAAETLTLERVRAGPMRDDRTVALALETRIFGTLRGTITLPTGDRDGEAPGIDWRADLVYPGLRRGEKLRRETTLPPRATIEARDGTPIAKGPERVSDLGLIASEIAGTIGPASKERAAELERRGVPPGAPVGLTGLEREFDERLTGTPGGTL